ncbi:MAG: hypothetical protein ACI9HE_003478 [Planctomycetota bacterium]|jgi:hypothetical protein
MTDEGKQGSRPGCVGKSLQLFAVCVLSLLFLTEVVVRFLPLPGLAKSDLIPENIDPLAGARTTGHPYLGYSLTPDWDSEATPDKAPGSAGYQGQKSQNADGFRGPVPPLEKPEGVFRIATLGGSSTYGNSPSSDASTWPAQLQVMLNERQSTNVEVLNAGAVGWNSHESLINLALRVVDYEPDLILVYHTINDARCALWTKGGEIQRDNTHWRETWPSYRDTPTTDPWLEGSYTYLLWRKFFTPYFANRKELAFYAIRGYDPDDKDPYERGELDPTGFRSFERNLLSIAGIARAHGAQVMLATQGCDREDIKAKSRHNQWKAMDYLGTVIEQVTEREQLLFCDARKVLEAHAASVGKDTIFTGEVHLTDAGAAKLAEIFADAIVEAKVLTD